MYEIVFAHRAKKAIKKRKRSGSFDRKGFESLVTLLANGKLLPARYEDHQLKGVLADYRECHVAFDFLVRYKRNDTLRLVTIFEVGTHDELFGR